MTEASAEEPVPRPRRRYAAGHPRTDGTHSTPKPPPRHGPAPGTGSTLYERDENILLRPWAHGVVVAFRSQPGAPAR